MSDVGTWKKRGLLGRARGNARALLRGRDGDAGEEQIKISVAPCEPEAKPERAPAERPSARQKARGAEMVLTENPARACERGVGEARRVDEASSACAYSDAGAKKPNHQTSVSARSARATRTDRRESIPRDDPRTLRVISCDVARARA